MQQNTVILSVDRYEQLRDVERREQEIQKTYDKYIENAREGYERTIAEMGKMYEEQINQMISKTHYIELWGPTKMQGFTRMYMHRILPIECKKKKWWEIWKSNSK